MEHGDPVRGGVRRRGPWQRASSEELLAGKKGGVESSLCFASHGKKGVRSTMCLNCAQKRGFQCRPRAPGPLGVPHRSVVNELIGAAHPGGEEVSDAGHGGEPLGRRLCEDGP